MGATVLCMDTKRDKAPNAKGSSDLTRAVAAQIRAERAAKGWTQAETFTRANMAKSTYIRIETGTRGSPDIDQIEKIAEAFGLSTSVLVARAQDRVGELPPRRTRAEKAADERRAKTHRELIREGIIEPDPPSEDDNPGELRNHG